jgi:VanZ family protein
MQLNFLRTQFYNLLKNNKVYLVYIPLVIYWILLFVLTSLPSGSAPDMIKVSDKLKHFGAYGLLAFLLSLTIHFQEKSKFLKQKNFLITVGIIALYALIDEIHQAFIPGRNSEFWDWFADILGALFGIVITKFLIKPKTSRTKLSEG